MKIAERTARWRRELRVPLRVPRRSITAGWIGGGRKDRSDDILALTRTPLLTYPNRLNVRSGSDIGRPRT
jgi:hypothetical protein